MRILLVSPYFPPRNAIGALRVHAFARYWARAGEAVTVLTTSKREYQRGLDLPRVGFDVVEVEYGIPRLLERLRNTLRSNGEDVPSRVPAAGWRRILRHLQDRTGIFGSTRMPDFTDRWVRPALQWARRQNRWDVVVSSCGPYTAHLVAMSVKREGLAARWVADYRDLWVDHHVFRGLFPFTLRERALERQCLEAADLLVTVSEELARILRAKTSTPVEVIFNGLDRKEIQRLPPGGISLSNGRTRLVYTGAIYLDGQDPTPLLRALAVLRRVRSEIGSRLELIVSGHGSDHWVRLARRWGVDDIVHDRGEVGRATALAMQRDADVLVVLDWKASSAGVLTGKLFDYLGATAPILVVGGCRTSSLARIVEESGRGIYVGDDDAAIRDALIAAVDAPRTLQRTPKVEFIDTLTRRSQSLRCLEAIRKVRGVMSNG